jgi:hypothetical protein
MPAGENATGLPEMTESPSRAGKCGGNQTRSPNFYLELLSWQGIPANEPIVLQAAHSLRNFSRMSPNISRSQTGCVAGPKSGIEASVGLTSRVSTTLTEPVTKRGNAVAGSSPELWDSGAGGVDLGHRSGKVLGYRSGRQRLCPPFVTGS